MIVKSDLLLLHVGWQQLSITVSTGRRGGNSLVNQRQETQPLAQLNKAAAKHDAVHRAEC